MRKPSLLVIFLTVFMDLVGFGIVVPMVPLYGKLLVPDTVTAVWAQGLIIGVIISAFSAMQFIFSPVWGRLSDRHGRRPILLLSTAGACASYVLFALSTWLPNHAAALGVMVLSRMLAGLFGGNITVAQAYIADISPPEQRSRMMGLIGMAFGLGFIFGPAIGFISFKSLGLSGPGWLAAAMCGANFILAFFILVESLKPTSEHVAQRPHLDQWLHTLGQPKIGLLVIVFFLATFCFSCFESTLPLLVTENFHLDLQLDQKSATTVFSLFVYCGLIGAFVQGGAIGRLVKMLGEPKLIAVSLVLTAASMAWLPFIGGVARLSWGVLLRHQGLPWVAMLAALALLAVGTGLTRPPLFGLLSNLTPPREQGATLGVAQSAGSLARILGPLFATPLLGYSPPVPYVVCAAILLGTTFLVMRGLCSSGA